MFVEKTEVSELYHMATPNGTAGNDQLEIFCLVWLDDNTDSKDARKNNPKLLSIINRLENFGNVKDCRKFVEQRSQEERLIMIVNGRLGQDIVPSIHQFRQVVSIYVYCANKEGNEKWTRNFKKVKINLIARN